MTVAIGFFDGVHKGHREILNGADFALTFENHPLTVINPGKEPAMIMSRKDCIEEMKKCGVKDVLILPFTKELADETPEFFLSHLKALFSNPPILKLRAGENWKFGRGGVGDAALARKHGIEVETIPYAMHAGKIISSTRIRNSLSSGDVESAMQMLGHAFILSGVVVSGKGIGRTIHKPTINVKLSVRPPIPFGVYGVMVDGEKAIANYGFAPTAGDLAWHDPMFEIHFPFSVPDKYKAIEVTVLKFIRHEEKFASFNDLLAQMEKDIAKL